jgi:ubiquitin C-terminal hydrolase
MEITDSTDAMDRIESMKMKYDTCGTSAFNNMGNTCYLNSVLQTLCANKLLTVYFIDSSSPFYYKKDLEHGCILQLLKTVKADAETGLIRISDKDLKRV